MLPDPVVRPRRLEVDVETLRRDLAAAVDGEVRFDTGSLATYATDSSNYRQVPIGLVVPRTVDAAVEAVRVCARHGVPVLSRGAGTSLAGECTNAAVVIDWTKYCHRIESVDLDRRVALVQPGIVLDELNAAVADHDLMVGPKPATHTRCTIGGMLGNNSCGSTAQAFGKAVDNMGRMEVLLYDGTRLWVGGDQERYDEVVAAGGRPAELYQGLRELAEEYGDDIRERYPDIPRRVSGYNLDDLLPEKGFDLARALVGSESTLVTILRAEITLVPLVPARRFVMLGYPDVAAAADHAPVINTLKPIIFEGLDRRLIEHEKVKHLNPTALDLLPEGDAWLLVVMGGDDEDEAERRGKQLLEAVGREDNPPSHRVFDKQEDQEHIMDVRESGLGATAWVPGEHSTWPGWEDAAVAPEQLGDYLREYRDLLERYGFERTSVYGHFGQGCVHCRIPFELATARGIDDFERFLDEAAHLVVRHGGSLSGEHGDGQARGALLSIMLGDRLVTAMGRMKALFDPDDRMNPGKVVRPYGPTENLRLGADYRPDVGKTQFAYPDDHGRFESAALRCVGVGACRSHEGGVMCPSYRATGEEEHSTRGRARLLFEMVNGEEKVGPVQDGWRSEAVKDALDLCLACKGCRSDCPVNVDMATYKAEFLSHHYRHRLRPLSHYSMGWLPVAAWFARLAPGLANRALHTPGLSRLIHRAGGIDAGRPMPYFADERFSDWFARRDAVGAGMRGDVLLFPDTFNNTLHPAVAKAAVEVLEDAGYRVILPEQTLCCGLTWVSTGQLEVARFMLRRTARALAPYLRRGVPLVGLEPSCTAVFRSDGPELIPDDDDVTLLQRQTRTLAELLDGTDGWLPPKIDRRAVVQPHCHQHAVLGTDADERILDKAGIDAEVLGGCCGLAGNFGFEDGHLDVSIGAAKHELLPAVDGAEPDTVVLADGFSCQTQTEQLAEGRRAMHLAEILALGIREVELGKHPERLVERPGRPGRVSRKRIASITPFAKSERP